MRYQTTRNNIRILVMDEMTGATYISRVSVTFRYFKANIAGPTLCAEMYFHGDLLPSVILLYLAELLATLQAYRLCWT